MNRKDCALIIFSKAPVPGQVKTRLVPVLGEEGAASLYLSLLRQTLKIASQSRISEVLLYCTPTVLNPSLQRSAEEFAVDLQLQQGDNLGQRMYSAFEETLTSFRSAIIIGCDCPELTVDDINTAYEQLQQGHDWVVGPAEDGGYYLIGTNKLDSCMFEGIVWGGADVLSATRERVLEFGLSCFELPERWDVDRPEDLERYYNIDKAQ